MNRFDTLLNKLPFQILLLLPAILSCMLLAAPCCLIAFDPKQLIFTTWHVTLATNQAIIE